MSPDVTIAIPTYNRIALLPRALESALNQKGGSIEIIISDDGSTDGTQEFLSKLSNEKVRCFTKEKNSGIHVNMNTCLDAARGNFFLLLSDDDYLLPGCIENLMQPWKKYNNLVFTYGQWWYERDGKRSLQRSMGPEIETGFEYVLGCWKGCRPTITHGVLFKTEDIRAIGGIPKGYAQDTLLQQRIAFEGDVAHVPVPVTTYSFHSGSLTNKLNLYTLIRDREVVLKMCLTVAKEKKVGERYLATLARLGKMWFLRTASHGIVSSFAMGCERRNVLKEAYRLKKYLNYGCVQCILSLLMISIFPRTIVIRIRAIYKNRQHQLI